MNDNLKGLLLGLTGVLILSPDTLVIRLINLESWTFLFWRSTFTFIGYIILVFIFHHGEVKKTITSTNKQHLWIALMYTGSAIFFVFSLSLTTVTNTLILLSTAPFFSALLSRFFLKEAVHWQTWLAIFIVFSCVVAIVSDSFFVGNIWGDFFGLGAGICLAGALVSSRKIKSDNILVILLISNVLVCITAFLVGDFITMTKQQMWLALLDGIIICLSFFLLSTAPRFISATQVSLMMTLEVVFGGFLVWWVIGEQPTFIALIASTIIMLTLLLNYYFFHRRKTKAQSFLL